MSLGFGQAWGRSQAAGESIRNGPSTASRSASSSLLGDPAPIDKTSAWVDSATVARPGGGR